MAGHKMSPTSLSSPISMHVHLGLGFPTSNLCMLNIGPGLATGAEKFKLEAMNVKTVF